MQRLQKTHLAQISSHLHRCKHRLIMKNLNTATKLRFSRGMTSCGGMVNDIQHYIIAKRLCDSMHQKLLNYYRSNV